MDPILEAARAKRAKLQTKLDALLVKPTDEARELNDTESSEFEAIGAKLKKLDAQVRGLEKEQKRQEKAAAAQVAAPPAVGGAVVRSEQMTYGIQREAGRYTSYLRDLAAIMVPEAGWDAGPASERMRQHHKEMEIEARHDPILRRNLHEIAKTPESLLYRNQHDFETRVNPNTTLGTGGEFVPPLWLVSAYAPLVRFDRICANRCKNLPLPPGIDLINVPKITTGSLTAVQATQGSGVSSQDIVTSTVAAAVNTIAGQEDISLQLLEQSPIAMDNVVFDDLTRDYSRTLDKQILTGTGVSGQHLGVLAQTATGGTSFNTDITKANAVTVSSIVFSDQTTANTQSRAILSGMTQVEMLRIAPATGIWGHPRRVNSWAYNTDTLGRPVFLPSQYGQYNAFGLDQTVTEQGVKGEMFGLPVIADGNIPTVCSTGAITAGTGDVVAVLKEDDMWLWEGTLRMRALPEILSGTLQIRFQVYAYSAFMPHRFPPSTSILTGTTGFALPVF